MQAVWQRDHAGLARTRPLQDQKPRVQVDSFTGRASTAKTAENRVEGYLLYNDKRVYHSGVENFLPVALHNQMKFGQASNSDQVLETIRHFPDLATDRALIQVKSAPNEEGYRNVVFEQACYEASLRIRNWGVPVLIVWVFADGSLHANWVERLKVEQAEKQAERGSGTPMTLVSKGSLLPMKYFINSL